MRHRPMHYTTARNVGMFGQTACKNNDAIFAVNTIEEFMALAVEERCRRCNASKTTAFHWKKYQEKQEVNVNPK